MGLGPNWDQALNNTDLAQQIFPLEERLEAKATHQPVQEQEKLAGVHGHR